MTELGRYLTGVAMAATVLAGLSSCGYHDDNGAAAQLVAQRYLDAYHQRQAREICALVAPEINANLAAVGGGTCEGAVRPTLKVRVPALTAELPSPHEGDRRISVGVREQPRRLMILGKYGSIWRVIDGGTAG